MKKTYFSPTTHSDAVVNKTILMVSSNLDLKYNESGDNPLYSV